MVDGWRGYHGTLRHFQELCVRCGNTFGSHCADGRGSLCPANEGRMDYIGEHGPKFSGSGVFEDPMLTERYHNGVLRQFSDDDVIKERIKEARKYE